MTEQLPPNVQTISDRLGEAWGETVDVGPGWFELITRLDTQLARLSPGYVLEQCKTKYGTLRYYARPEDSEDVDTQVTFNEIIRDAEDESARICEDCGEPGQQVALHGWIWTLCATHTQHRLRSEPAR